MSYLYQITANTNVTSNVIFITSRTWARVSADLFEMEQLALRVECSPMIWKTGVQSLVES